MHMLLTLMSKIGQLLTDSSILSRFSHQRNCLFDMRFRSMRGIQIWHNDSNIEKQLSGSLLGSFLWNIEHHTIQLVFHCNQSAVHAERVLRPWTPDQTNKQPLNIEYSKTLHWFLLWSTKISAENFCQSLFYFLFISGVYLRLRGEWLKGRCLHVWCNWVNGRSGGFWPYFIVEGRRRGKILRHVDH